MGMEQTDLQVCWFIINLFDKTFQLQNVLFLNSVQTHLFWCSLEAAASNEMFPMSAHNIVIVIQFEQSHYDSLLI